MAFIAALDVFQNNIETRVPISTGSQPKDVNEGERNIEATEGREKSFIEDIRDCNVSATPLKSTPLRVEGRNVIVEIDEEDIKNEVMCCQYDVNHI